MLSFVKTSAGNGEIHYAALDGETDIGECTLRLNGCEIALTYTVKAYENFVLASCVNAASSFGLPVSASYDERLTKYGFTPDGDGMRVRPDKIVFPAECGKTE